MAFDVKAQYGEPIGTSKPTERLVVQLVEVTNQNGKNARVVVDLRTQYENGNGSWLGTKSGFMLNTREQVENLIDALSTVIDDDDWVETSPKAQEAAEEVPTKTVKRRKRSSAAPTTSKRKK